MGKELLWIVSDQAFSCLRRNSDFVWRVSAGERIIQAEIILEKGIVYLSRENDLSKVGLRSLQNGNLKWETHVGNVSKFSFGEQIYLDDGTTLDFDGATTTKKGNFIDRKRKDIRVSKNELTIGSNTFSYNLEKFGEPKLPEIYDNDLLISSESGMTMFYRDLKLVWTRDESLTQVLASIFIKVGHDDVWVAVTKRGKC
jgi:hypothetical protein